MDITTNIVKIQEFTSEQIGVHKYTAGEVEAILKKLLEVKESLLEDRIEEKPVDNLIESLFENYKWNRVIFSIHGSVYDATSFLLSHPGGPQIVLKASGTDATKYFDQVNHSRKARNMLKDYIVGVLV